MSREFAIDDMSQCCNPLDYRPVLLRFIFVVAIVLATLIAVTTDGEALVQRDASLSPNAIAQARWLFLSNDPRRLKPGEIRQVAIPASLLDQGVNYIASRRLPARGTFTVTGDAAEIRISLLLFAGRHANLRLKIGSHDGQPRLAEAQLGSLPLPAALVASLGTAAIAASGYQREIDMAQTALRAVDIDSAGQRLLVTYSWEPALLDRARNIAFDPQDLEALHAAQNDFAARLAHLANGAKVPLTEVLGPLLHERDRSGQRAVLLVLAAYLAEKNLANLVPQAAQWPKPRPVMLTLLNRYDSRSPTPLAFTRSWRMPNRGAVFPLQTSPPTGPVPASARQSIVRHRWHCCCAASLPKPT